LGIFPAGFGGGATALGMKLKLPKSATRRSAILASKLPKKQIKRLPTRLNDSNSIIKGFLFLILGLAV
jgi:hypothetical protein